MITRRRIIWFLFAFIITSYLIISVPQSDFRQLRTDNSNSYFFATSVEKDGIVFGVKKKHINEKIMKLELLVDHSRCPNYRGSRIKFYFVDFFDFHKRRVKSFEIFLLEGDPRVKLYPKSYLVMLMAEIPDEAHEYSVEFGNSGLRTRVALVR